MTTRLVPEGSGKRIVGLTGGFGSGKSTVAEFFKGFGACVLNADPIAKEILKKGAPHYEEVAALFPEAIRQSSPELDRKKIGEIVFRDSIRRKRLESIAHPYVLQRFMEEAERTEAKIILLEVPLLFEAGFQLFCDHVIAVKAREPVMLERLLAKGFSLEEIEARRKAQFPLEEKLKQADIVIDNSGTLETTKREAEKVWKTLRPVLKGEN